MDLQPSKIQRTDCGDDVTLSTDDMISILIDTCQVRVWVEKCIVQLGGRLGNEMESCGIRDGNVGRCLRVMTLSFQVAAGLRRVLIEGRTYLHQSPFPGDDRTFQRLERTYYPFVGRGLRMGLGESLDDYPAEGLCLDEKMMDIYKTLIEHPRAFGLLIPPLEDCFLSPAPENAPADEKQWALFRYKLCRMLESLLRRLRAVEMMVSESLRGAWGRETSYSLWAPRVEMPWFDEIPVD